MPIDTFLCLPSGSGSGGDLVYRTDASVALIRPFAGNVLKAGSVVSGKSSIASGFFVRFEIDIPLGATFVGARMSQYISSTTGSGVNAAHSIGVIDNDTHPDWTGSLGWAHGSYVNSSQVPRPYVGLTKVDGEFYRDAGFISGEGPAGYGVNDRIAFGTGTLSGEVDFAGLLAEVQAWFDAKEALRDTGVGNGIPITFAWASNNATPHYEFFVYDNTHGSLPPTLEIEYGTGAISARLESRSLVSAKLVTQPLVSSRLVVRPLVSGRLRIK